MTLEQLLADQLTGRARFLRDRNEIKSPELMGQAAATIARLQAENEALLIALHDAISRPMGVVPASADQFYSPAMADRAQAIRALKSPKPPIL